jgi:2OG-Fe(II) oxygenase superfamily
LEFPDKPFVTDAASAPIAPLRAPYLVVDDFLPIAEAERLRAGIEAHFARPDAHSHTTHQIWNYWFVPGLYTYLRTNPEKLIARPHVDAFVETLRAWSIRTLGMADVTWPFLSLYINGCRQGVHNDSTNGHFAFVYSLTRNERRSIGGETLIYHEGDLFRRGLRRASAGADFHAEVAPRFNRLVVFDDRLPHGVSPVEGPMDPLEGRFVLHGHLRSAGALVEGALSPESVNQTILEPMTAFLEAAPRIEAHSGMLMLRLSVAPSGAVAACAVLVDRVVALDERDAGWPALAEAIRARASQLAFPAAESATTITLPIMLSGGA